MHGENASLEGESAIQEEDRKISQLRSLVDAALLAIRRGRLSLEAAALEVEQIRTQALRLFPGKEETFDLIYRPRFQRAITETFKSHQ